MKIELQHQLCKKYPSIFREMGGDPKDSCMAWGIECGDGWHDLLDILCKTITSHVDHANRLWPSLKFAVVAAQVKEKYGSLRFYTDFVYAHDLEIHDLDKVNKYINEINGMIMMAEIMSAHICENCGEKGTRGNEVFPRVECDSCNTLRRDAEDSRIETEAIR